MFDLIEWLLACWRESLSAHSCAPTARRPRLGLETLEDRSVPSVLPVGAAIGHGPGCPCCMTCGCSSVTPSADYRFGGTNSSSSVGAFKWPQSALGQPVTITYSYSNLLDGRMNNLPPATIRSIIEEALGRWAAVAPLRFNEVPDRGPTPSTTDYNGSGLPMMRFGHLAIDGPNNILAYAYYPGLNGLSGDVFFDRAERWALSPSGGIDLLEVAIHEIGHALGLAHEPMPENGGRAAIMNPIYVGRFNGPGSSFLLPDDVAGIRALYGTGVGWVRPLLPSQPQPGPMPPDDGRPAPVPPPDPAFAIQGNTLLVLGTSGNDTFRFVADTLAPTIEINGRAFAGSLAGIDTIRFDGRGGADTITLVGSRASETFTLTPGSASVIGGQYRVEAVAMRTITAVGGPGDALVVRGTTADETFTARPTTVSLVSAGRTVTATGFGQVTLESGGGTDTAQLYDSPGDDTLQATPTQTILSGSSYRITANFFARVEVYASTGNDVATLNGSTGEDTFLGRPLVSWLSGPGFFVRVHRFDWVTANTLAGNDRALFYDGPGNDSLLARPGYARLSGPGYWTEVTGVARVEAYAQAGGHDTAHLIGSSADEVFISLPGVSSFRGPGYVHVVQGFRTVRADGNGGTDRAQITGAAHGVDSVSGSGSTGVLSRPGEAVVFSRFSSVTLNGSTGINRRQHGPFAFQVIWLGMWW